MNNEINSNLHLFYWAMKSLSKRKESIQQYGIDLE